jgi:hypothetical protein
VYRKTGKAKKSETAKEDAPATLYIPGIKIDDPCLTKITCRIKGKLMPCKMETYKPISKDKCCPFQFPFKWESQTNHWSLDGSTGWGGHHHEYHLCSSSHACKVVELPNKIAEYPDATAKLAITLLAFKSNIDSDQVLLLFAWVSDAEQHLFQLFPEVKFWDTAQKTNREKGPLSLACGKEANNSSFTYLWWAFMPPSKCMWVFNSSGRWII